MTDKLKPISLYIHWPFCKSKCPYCDFNSHVREQVDEQAFVAALLSELDYMLSLIGKRQLISVFFGGGTPSLMAAETVEKILEYIHTKFTTGGTVEITLEANPTSVEAGKFKEFRAAGVNRVSLGVQSLKAESLTFLGREHSANEALQAVKLAADIFPRYSFDLIYALPNQTVSHWQAELNEALQYVDGHMSLYQLTIEERTAFYHAYHQEKAFDLPVDDLAADLYEVTQDIMEAHGLPTYEISNHAKPGEESQHNLSYWLGREYIGIGPGAHGRLFLTPPGSPTDRDSCSHNTVCATATIKSPELWLDTVQKQGHGLETCAPLSAKERMEERLMMRLRLTGTIPLAELPPLPTDILQTFEKQRLILLTDDSLQLTRQGILLQQHLVSELLTQVA